MYFQIPLEYVPAMTTQRPLLASNDDAMPNGAPPSFIVAGVLA
jgi:hypothetical protein